VMKAYLDARHTPASEPRGRRPPPS
jgi:hypothetical protein